MVWIRFDFVFNRISNDWGPLSYKFWISRMEASCCTLEIILYKLIKETEFAFSVCLPNQESNPEHAVMKMARRGLAAALAVLHSPLEFKTWY